MVYNIVIVANEAYIQHSAVMLCSLFETNRNKHFDIYLLTDGIKDETCSKLQGLCTRYNSRLFVKQPEIELGKTLNINLKDLPIGQWSTTTNCLCLLCFLWNVNVVCSWMVIWS